MELPNQSVTWGKEIESFDDWKSRQSCAYASEGAALGMYLQEQLRIEGESMPKLKFKNVLVGLPVWLGEYNNRAQELLYAYLALTVERNETPARLLIRGIRLMPGLHPDYVKRTRCYGV